MNTLRWPPRIVYRTEAARSTIGPIVQFDTKYALKLFFTSPAFVQVYHEAVANAIDADADAIKIDIRTQGSIKAPEIQISIHDNGVGFNVERYDRFKRVVEPKDAQHKGLGRLIYLRYFREVAVTSVFEGQKRSFLFVHNFDGKSALEPAAPAEPNGTTLVFRHFQGEQLKSYEDLKPSCLRKKLLEQFLPLLYERKRAGRPISIDIDLVTSESNPQKDFFSNKQRLDGSDLPELKSSIIQDKTIDWCGKINVHYLVKTGQPDPTFVTAAVVDRRTIPLKLLSPGSVPAGTSVFFLFESELFNGKADAGRQRLELPPGVQEADLYRALKQKVGRILSDELPEIKTRNADTKRSFENNFPHLIGLFDRETVGLIERDEALEAAQRQFFLKQKEVLESDSRDEGAFQKSLELSARSLMEYILYRDWVIKRLRDTSPKDREETIHDLLVPRYNRFEESNFVQDIYRNNAWVLDDRFMTFRTILSEATMTELVSAITLGDDRVDDGRPDISMIFSADPEKERHVDVVVVELKRKTNDDRENTYAKTQLLKRARKLVDTCPNIQRVWYYGIIEIDADLDQLLRDDGWIPLHSKGTVFYKEHKLTRASDGVSVPTPFFLLSFDAVTADAAARNHTFLELLKSKFKRQATSEGHADAGEVE